jgi:hypothetical protein
MNGALVRGLLVGLLCTAVALPAVAADGSDSKSKVRASVGLGLGIPYGVLGVNGDVGVGPVELTAGLGLLGWNVGARLYPSLKYDKKGSPTGVRFSAFYGVNTILDTYDDWELRTGLTVGVGARFGPFDIDLLFPFSDIPDGYERASFDTPVKLSVGFRFDLMK